jgi:transcriptional regulator with XRE-family HTH domain
MHDNTNKQNDALRYQRLLHGWSLQRVADEVRALGRAENGREPGVNGDMVGEWERGVKKPSPFYQEKLCLLYHATADELGLVESPKTSRRSMLQALSVGVASAGLITTPQVKLPSFSLTSDRISESSDQAIRELASKTQLYRTLQRNGMNVEHDVRGHIALIQETLESTTNDRKRRDLWTILAQSQILVRLSITKEREMARARTWNESAIASAQYADDALLVAAAIGHLAHLHLMWQKDTTAAGQLLDQARDFGQDHPALAGWFSIVGAAIAAKGGKIQQSEDLITQAKEIAQTVAHTPGYADAFFTDFGVAGVTAFAGNSLLKSGAPVKALGQLTPVKLEDLADNRQASLLYDISASYAALGELEPAQAYALHSIDKALATDRLYIIPRFISLSSQIQKKDRHEPHAAAIAEYAHNALQQQI